jgi:ribosome biogenesis GTPase A
LSTGGNESGWKRLTGFLELNPYICHGCGAPFQSKSPDAPGFLPKEKMAAHRISAEAIRKEQETMKLLRDAGYEIGSDTANRLLLNAKTPVEVIDRITQRIASTDVAFKRSLNAAEPSVDAVEMHAAKDKYKEELGDVACTCQRCFRLQQYGQIQDSLRPGWSENELLTPEHFEKVLSVINQTKAVVVCLVDLFDLKGSILTNLKQIAGKNPIVIAANKVDLLPNDISKIRVRDRIYDMIRDECDLMSPKEAEEKKFLAMKQRGWIRPNELKSEAYVLYRQNVHLVSCESGTGMNELMKGIFSLAKDNGNKIYVMGAANVGKSSFINKLLNIKSGRGGGSGNKKAQKPRSKWEPTATVSNLPGTTLNFLKINMHDGITVFDTPGLMNKGQLTALLTAKELNDVIPDKPIHPVTLRLDEGRCALIGGIAKVEMIQVQ